MSETYDLEHDIQLMIDYVIENWRPTNVDAPEKIFCNYSIGEDPSRNRTQTLRYWMFHSCVQLEEDPTQYSLLDMRGNADRENDTVFNVLVFSKDGSHTAIRMFREFLHWLQEYAFEDISGHYAFVKILDSHAQRKPYSGRVTFSILLTRRGVGHIP